MANIVLNAPPTPIADLRSASTATPTQDWDVVTLSPRGNISTTYEIDYGGKQLTGEVPQGSPVPLPISQKWNNSTVTVKNTGSDEQSILKAGIYGFNPKPPGKTRRPQVTKPLKGKVDINQYESTAAEASSAPMTLTLTARTQDAALLSIIIGSDAPQNIALNVDPKILPPQWKKLPGFKAIQGQTHQISRNFFGQTVFVVNVSLTKVPVAVELS